MAVERRGQDDIHFREYVNQIKDIIRANPGIRNYSNIRFFIGGDYSDYMIQPEPEIEPESEDSDSEAYTESEAETEEDEDSGNVREQPSTDEAIEELAPPSIISEEMVSEIVGQMNLSRADTRSAILGLPLVIEVLNKMYPLRSLNIVDEEVTDDTRVLECKVCTINKVCVVLTRCGHTFCRACTKRFENKCATCRTPFAEQTIVQMFI
jgi:hypothetical protein